MFNYLDGSWAQFNDSFTCFGYWQRETDITWAQLTRPWNTSNFSWDSQVLSARYPNVIAGNQRGFVFVFTQQQDIGQNAPTIPIANINPVTRLITAPNHNLVNSEYILLTNIQGITSGNTSGTPNNIIYQVTNASATDFIVDQIDPLDDWAGTYTGDGLITPIPNISIRTKEFNPFYEKGDSVRVNYIDIYVDRTDDGQFDCQFFASSNDSLPIETSTVLTSPEPNPSFSSNQARIWHRIYTNTFGSFFQNLLTMNDAQMRDINITTSDIRIHGLIFYVNAAGRISYDL